MKYFTTASMCFMIGNAIVIRDDVDDSQYLGNASEYPAVFPMDPTGDKERGQCAATLIGKQHAVTAAHCFDDGEWSSFQVDING